MWAITSSSKASASLPKSPRLPLTVRPSALKPALMPENDGDLNEAMRFGDLEGPPSAASGPRGGLFPREGKLNDIFLGSMTVR